MAHASRVNAEPIGLACNRRRAIANFNHVGAGKGNDIIQPRKLSWTILLFAVLAFAWIAADVLAGGPLTVADTHVSGWFHLHASPPVTGAMLVITHAHDTVPVTIATVLAALYLLWRKYWRGLACLLFTVPFGMLLNAATAHAFQRARPVFTDPLLVVTTFSFPSGHVTAATLTYGLLAVMLAAKTSVLPARIAIMMAAAMMIALVALSRVYLGVHYPTDVAAAFAEGIAWLALVVGTAQTPSRVHGSVTR